jgi:hypothetical protein
MTKKDPNRFYVYLYLRSKDSEHGKRLTPYYVGKGNGWRAFSKNRGIVPVPKDKSYIVFVQEGLNEEQAFLLERYCISLYGRIDRGTGILRNLTDGGEGISGFVQSETTRQKISQSNKKAYASEELRRHTSEIKKGENNPNWGRKGDLSARWGVAHTDATKRKMSRSREKFLYELIDSDGEVYITSNLREFAEQYGLANTHLYDVINGKAKQHKGWTGRIVETLR